MKIVKYKNYIQVDVNFKVIVVFVYQLTNLKKVMNIYH